MFGGLPPRNSDTNKILISGGSHQLEAQPPFRCCSRAGNLYHSLFQQKYQDDYGFTGVLSSSSQRCTFLQSASYLETGMHGAAEQRPHLLVQAMAKAIGFRISDTRYNEKMILSATA